jgi:hypothetical protein
MDNGKFAQREYRIVYSCAKLLKKALNFQLYPIQVLQKTHIYDEQKSCHFSEWPL